MKLLLIVGSANDIFVYNYSKWLKASMDVTIDVFEFYHNEQQSFDFAYFNHVYCAHGYQLPLPKMRGLIDAFVRSHELSRFIQDKHYDVIHVQRLVSPVVLQKHLHEHCGSLIMTFWGGEFIQQKVFYSTYFYLLYLDRFSKHVDYIINGDGSMNTILSHLPHFQGKYKRASFGSAPLEVLYDLMKKESREESKRILGFPEEKCVVLIGYSGKTLHRHIDIINELKKYPLLQPKIHLLAPMTRGADPEYTTLVERELMQSGYSYTLIKGVFLSDIEIGRIRNATDIVLQLSDFDGFSRSIVECLCAKSILIYGNWLGYKKYMPPSGFDGIEVKSIEEGVSIISNILDHQDVYHDMTNKNSENGRHQAIWSECIIDWVNVYKEALSN